MSSSVCFPSMQKTSNNTEFHFQKSTQISEMHCGPAVLAMLLNHIGITVSQEAITDAAGVADTIADNGTRIDQMVTAIDVLHLDAMLWYKEHATLADIKTLLTVYHLPVGVEWQGLFEEDEDEFDENSGHYSIVTAVDDGKKELIIVDPYKDFAEQDRIITQKTFLKRWWDENEIDSPSGKIQIILDKELLFVVTHKKVSFPGELALTPGRLYNASYQYGSFSAVSSSETN